MFYMIIIAGVLAFFIGAVLSWFILGKRNDIILKEAKDKIDGEIFRLKSEVETFMQRTGLLKENIKSGLDTDAILKDLDRLIKYLLSELREKRDDNIELRGQLSEVNAAEKRLEEIIKKLEEANVNLGKADTTRKQTIGPIKYL